MAASIPSVTPPPSSTTAATPGLRTATDLDQLWEAIQTAIRSVIQVRHISLLVQPFPGSPPLLYPVDDRGEASEGALRHGELSPVLRYVLHRPTVRLVRLSDFTPVEALVRMDFYRRFMKPNGYRHILAMSFWSSQTFQACVQLFRSEGEHDFGAPVMRSLEELHPALEADIQRVLDIHRHQTTQDSFERLFGGTPQATVLLDRSGALRYMNPAAEELCTVWNFGPTARSQPFPRPVRVPEGVVARSRDVPFVGAIPREPILVAHPNNPQLSAQISPVYLDVSGRSSPLVLVRLFEQSPDEEGRHLAPAPLSKLSEREREVASLAAEGLSNQEIAERLNKSVLTVKKQLQSIFRKVEVPTRTRLINALLIKRVEPRTPPASNPSDPKNPS